MTRCFFLHLSLLAITSLLCAELPQAVDQIESLTTLPDQTDRLQQLITDSGGSLIPAAGVYRITSPLEFTLEQSRSTVIRSSDGPVTLIMDGPGPAIRIVGSHEGTASPRTFNAETWNERMPLIDGIEIIGNHPEADGIELIKCVQPTITRTAIRWCRHGILLRDRNRNVVISDVHLYENSGIGLFLDDVNLHQINVSNSHISYNREGGIVVRDGNVRNLHITGCDIEGNMPADDSQTSAANVLLDVSGSEKDKSRSIAEVAITGCTIQHSSNYSGEKYDEVAPGGANIRILGKSIWPVDSVTITGNVISDTSVLLDIKEATDITVTGNTFFAPNPDFLHASRCKRLLVNGNTFNPRQFERPGKIVLDACEDSLITNCTFRGLLAKTGAITIQNSQRINLSNNVLTESSSGLLVENSSDITISNWTVSGLSEESFITTDGTSSIHR